MRDEPSLAAVTAIFFRLVNLTFGGGDPTMAALHRELVLRQGWLGVSQYGLVYGLARATPGTNLVAFCAGAAWYMRGFAGALLAVAAATVPSSLVVVWITFAYQHLHDSRIATGIVAAVLSAAVGMMVAAAWQLVWPPIRRQALRTVVLFGAGSALLLTRSLGPIEVLLLAAVTGAFWREREG